MDFVISSLRRWRFLRLNPLLENDFRRNRQTNIRHQLCDAFWRRFSRRLRSPRDSVWGNPESTLTVKFFWTEKYFDMLRHASKATWSYEKEVCQYLAPYFCNEQWQWLMILVNPESERLSNIDIEWVPTFSSNPRIRIFKLQCLASTGSIKIPGQLQKICKKNLTRHDFAHLQHKINTWNQGSLPLTQV